MTKRVGLDIATELVAEFVEDRVRAFPSEAFDLPTAERAIKAMLKDGQLAIDVGPKGDVPLATLLDAHPFLVRAKHRSGPAWKPGLQRRAAR